MHVLRTRVNYEYITVHSSLVHRLNQKIGFSNSSMNEAMGMHAEKKIMGFSQFSIRLILLLLHTIL